MIKYRKYKDYGEYVKHQKRKLNLSIETRIKQFDKRYKIFKEDFSFFIKYMKKDDNIICLGARLGEEVKAFRFLGFESCIGIDLNTTKNNPYVIEGDFNNIPYKDNTFDVIYCNCIDHCYNIKDIVSEIRRIKKKRNLVILDISKYKRFSKTYFNNERPFESMAWENINEVLLKFEPYEVVNKKEKKDSTIFGLKLL